MKHLRPAEYYKIFVASKEAGKTEKGCRKRQKTEADYILKACEQKGHAVANKLPDKFAILYKHGVNLGIRTYPDYYTKPELLNVAPEDTAKLTEKSLIIVGADGKRKVIRKSNIVSIIY